MSKVAKTNWARGEKGIRALKNLMEPFLVLLFGCINIYLELFYFLFLVKNVRASLLSLQLFSKASIQKGKMKRLWLLKVHTGYILLRPAEEEKKNISEKIACSFFPFVQTFLFVVWMFSWLHYTFSLECMKDVDMVKAYKVTVFFSLVK